MEQQQQVQAQRSQQQQQPNCNRRHGRLQNGQHAEQDVYNEQQQQQAGMPDTAWLSAAVANPSACALDAGTLFAPVTKTAMAPAAATVQLPNSTQAARSSAAATPPLTVGSLVGVGRSIAASEARRRLAGRTAQTLAAHEALTGTAVPPFAAQGDPSGFTLTGRPALAHTAELALMSGPVSPRTAEATVMGRSVPELTAQDALPGRTVTSWTAQNILAGRPVTAHSAQDLLSCSRTASARTLQDALTSRSVCAPEAPSALTRNRTELAVTAQTQNPMDGNEDNPIVLDNSDSETHTAGAGNRPVYQEADTPTTPAPGKPSD